MDYAAVEAQAFALANQMMAERAKVDLYYLCSYILGGDGVLDPKVHGPLCRALRPLLMHKEIKAWYAEHQDEEFPMPEFPSDWGRTEEQGMPSDEEKQEFLEWQAQFIPDSTTGVAEDKLDVRLCQLLALMPRGTLKSTVITIGFTIQIHLNFRNARVLLDSEVQDKSKAFLFEIKGHWSKNKRLRTVYSTLYRNEDGSPMYPDQNAKGDVWNNDEINLSCRVRDTKEKSVETSGIDVAKNGLHYDFVIADDLHSEKNTKTKEQMDKAKDHYDLLFSLLDPDCPIVVVGTRWDDDDLYQKIIDNEADDYNFITRSAESEAGDLFYPSRLTHKFLDNYRSLRGGYLFSCQYLNNPVDQDNATFLVSQFKSITIEQFNAIPHITLGFVDPSYKGKHNKSDFAAFVLGAMGPRKEIYCRYAFKDKMKYSGIFDKMAELDDMFNPEVRLWWVEAIGTKSLEDDFDRMNDERVVAGKRRLNIRYNRSQPNSKIERIADLSPWYERGDAYHVHGGGMIDALESELKRFPKAKFDDLSDCWSGIIKKGYPPRRVETDEQVQKKKKWNKMVNKPRSPMTGY